MKKFLSLLIVACCVVLCFGSTPNPVSASPQVLLEAGQSALTQALTFSPDGKIMAAVAQDGSVRLWENSGAWRATLLDENSSGQAATALTFSPDGKTLAVGDREGNVRLWRVPEKSSALSSPAAIWKFGEGIIARQNAPENEKPSTARDGDEEIVALAFSGDGAKLGAAGYYGQARSGSGGSGLSGLRLHVWDAASGKSQWTKTFYEAQSRVAQTMIAFEDGSTLVATGAPNFVQKFDGTGNAGTPLAIPEAAARRGGAVLLALSSDGKSVLAKGQGDYKIYDTQTGKVTATLEAKPLAENPEANARRREMAERMTGRAMPERAPAAPSERLGFPIGAAFSPDNQTVAIVFTQSGARIWDANTGAEKLALLTRRKSSGALALAKNGLLALGDDRANIAVWQGENQQFVLPAAAEAVQSLEIFERVGAPILLVGAQSGALAQWNLATGKLENISGFEGRDLTALAVSPDGKLLARGGYLKDYTLTLSETGVGRGQLQVFDLETGKVLWTREDGGKSKLSHLQFSSDGTQLWLASEGGPSRSRAGSRSGDGFEALELLDARTGETATNVPELKDERIGSAKAFALAQNDSRLAVGDRNSVRVWALPEGDLRLRLNSSRYNNNIAALSPSGTWLALADPRGDGSIRMWDTTRVRETGRGRGGDWPDANLCAAPEDQTAPAATALQYSRLGGGRFWAGDARGRLLMWNEPTTSQKEAEVKQQKLPPVVLPEVILSELFASPVTVLCGTPNAEFANIVATGHADGSVRLWDTQNKKLIATMMVVPKVRDDAPVMLNMKNPEGAPLSLENFDWAAWTPDGFYAASPGGEKVLRWRDKETATPFNGEAAHQRADVLPQALRATLPK